MWYLYVCVTFFKLKCSEKPSLDVEILYSNILRRTCIVLSLSIFHVLCCSTPRVTLLILDFSPSQSLPLWFAQHLELNSCTVYLGCTIGHYVICFLFFIGVFAHLQSLGNEKMLVRLLNLVKHINKISNIYVWYACIIPINMFNTLQNNNTYRWKLAFKYISECIFWFIFTSVCLCVCLNSKVFTDHKVAGTIFPFVDDATFTSLLGFCHLIEIPSL